MWITTGKHCFFLNFVSRNFKYLILQDRVWRTGESEKDVDSHCPARISWVRVYSVLLVKGDEVSHVYTDTGELLPGLSSVFKSMHWQIHPRKHSGALAIKSSVVFLNIAWNLTWLPVEYHSLGKCHTPHLDMGLHLKTKACHFAEGSMELIFCIGFYFLSFFLFNVIHSDILHFFTVIRRALAVTAWTNPDLDPAPCFTRCAASM